MDEQEAESQTGRYREGLKNRELDQEAPQIFWPAPGSSKDVSSFGVGERGGVFKNTTRSEDEKYEVKPTPAKTDFAITSGIDDLLKEKLEKAFHKQTSKVRLHDIAKIA